MDLHACGEAAVEMWITVDAKLISRKQTGLDPAIQAQILSEAMKLYITNIIKESRQSSGSAAASSDDKPITEKQCNFITDLGGDPNKYKTAREASKYIEELKA